MYTAKELNGALRAIIARGTEVVPKGVAHKRNMLDPHAPMLPVKFHLCTHVVRKAKAGEPRLTGEDVMELGRLMWLHLKYQTHTLPRISAIPSAGSGLEHAMYAAAFKDNKNLRTVKLSKVDETFRVLVYAKPGDEMLWGVDDLINLGDTKGAAIRVWKNGGYRIEHMLTFLDYERGGRQCLEKWGIELHALATVESLLQIAEVEPALNPKLTPEVIAKTRELIAKSKHQVLAA